MKIINKQPIAFLKNLEKAFYKDNYQNRKLGRVGRPYGNKEEEEKSWDKIEDFYVKGSNENKLWDFWYKFQKSGDPSHMSSMCQIFEEKFPNVDSWKQTTPNTGKATITALSKNGDTIAEIDLSGDKVDLIALQTFMDKCHTGKGETEILVDKTETLKNAEGKRLDAIIKYSNSANEEGVEGIKVDKNTTDEEKRLAIAKFYKEAAEGDADNLDEIVEEALADYVPEKEEKISLSDFKDSRKRDIVKKALKEAKSSNKPFLVGINDDGEGYFIDDAIDYFPDLNKHRVIATCFPNGDIKRGFIEIEE